MVCGKAIEMKRKLATTRIDKLTYWVDNSCRPGSLLSPICKMQSTHYGLIMKHTRNHYGLIMELYRILIQNIF